MDRVRETDALVEKVLGGTPRVSVLRGPATSGKTTAALAFYRRLLDPQRGSRCLLLAPNLPAVAHLKKRLLHDSPVGVCLAPRAMTFAALAAAILASCESGRRAPLRRLGDFQRRLLLRRLVDGLAKAGELSSPGAVADTPGVVAALDRAIAELKRAAVEPATLARAIGEAKGKSRDLLRVYERYQAHLLETGAFDVEGQMWQARDELFAAAKAGTEIEALRDVQAIVADGFTDFTPTQLRILGLLSRGRTVLVTLTLGDDSRERMWQWTRRTMANIRAEFGENLQEIVMAGAAQGPPPAATASDGAALSGLAEGVFDFDSPRREAPAGLHLIAAAGVEAEVAAVARRVKGLLAAGEGSVAVLARSMREYRPILTRVFAEHDIPLSPPATPLLEAPILRFLFSVASLAPRFASADVLRTIKNSYFRPAAFGPYDAETVAAAEMLIREGNVLEGRPAYAQAAQRLAARAVRAAPVEAEGDEKAAAGPLLLPPKSIAAAAEMLAKLFDEAERAAATPSGKPPHPFGRLIQALDLRGAAKRHAEPALTAHDLRALTAMEGVLAQLRPPLPGPADLREALAGESCPPAREESLVEALDVLDARALRFDHVFVLGCSEGQFPRPPAESSLLGETERDAWYKRGIALDLRGDLSAREMLLYYLAISRAEKSLTLSYLESDATGRAAAPSLFLLSMLDPLGGLESPAVRSRLTRIDAGRFIPPAEEIASPRDALNAALVGLFAPRAEAAPAALAWAADGAREQILAAAGGLYARDRRWKSGSCDEFDGRLSSPDLLAALQERFSAEAVFSANQLDLYGQCPWFFFASYVLNLRELACPERRLEAVEKGLFCHKVLFTLMTRLRDEAGGPVRLAAVDEPRLTAALDEAVASASAEVEARRPPYPVLWRIQRDQMAEELRGYLRCQRDPYGVCTHFELAFGMEDVEAADPASRREPVAMKTPRGPVLLRGRIDRVDVLDSGDARGPLVIDYKTGRLPSEADLKEGRNLQMPVYVEAVEQILARPCLGGVFHHVGDAKERHFSELKPPRKDPRPFGERRAEAVRLIGEFVSGMRGGRFDALPSAKCPSYCPFREICQHADARAELKEAR